MRKNGFECHSRSRNPVVQRHKIDSPSASNPPKTGRYAPKNSNDGYFPSVLACRVHINSPNPPSPPASHQPNSTPPVSPENSRPQRSVLDEIMADPVEATEDVAADLLRIKSEEEATLQAVKDCPFCGKPTFKDGGCNYMKCSQSDPPSLCPGEWCFLCYKPKYLVIPGKEHLGYCNDPSHNSH
jgi:hypothetical protein